MLQKKILILLFSVSMTTMFVANRCMQEPQDLRETLHHSSLREQQSTARAWQEFQASNTQDNEGKTPLHRARSSESARFLLARGALVDIEDFFGNTPFHEYAVWNPRNSELAKTLLFYPHSIPTTWQSPEIYHNPTKVISLKDRCLNYLSSRKITRDIAQKLPVNIAQELARQRKVMYMKYLLVKKNKDDKTARDVALEELSKIYEEQLSSILAIPHPQPLLHSFIDQVIEADSLDDLRKLGYTDESLSSRASSKVAR